MKIHIQKGHRQEKTKVAFMFKKGSHALISVLNPVFKLDKKELEKSFQEAHFKGDKKTVFFASFKAGNLLVIGLGEESQFDYEQVRRASACMSKELKKYGKKTAEVLLESLMSQKTKDLGEISQALTEGAILSNYICDAFKLKKDDKSLKELLIKVDAKKQKACQQGCKQGTIVAEAVNFARDLGNYPGNLMTPAILANSIKKQTKNTKIKTTVWDKKRIQKEKMGGLDGVSLGSSQEPRFIIMEYKGSSKKPIILVGKGLTFDSGGISLKPSQAMDEMKFDMCGSIAVVGAMLAIERLGLKVNVMGLIPSSENMPGASANKPGDILKARNGKTMEVLNTDAEGRLILADALSYASEKKPQALFDVATLTGAMVVALGNLFTGFFTKNDSLAQRVEKASQKTGERLWRMPLVAEHSSDMKSIHADVANISSSKGAGSSTAAAFLEHFVDKNIPWVHFDIAGTAYNVHNRLDYCSPKQASGVMVRTFVEIARSFE